VWNKTPTTIVLSIYMCTTVLCIYVYGVPTVVLVHWTLTFTNIHIELSLARSLSLNIYVYILYYQLDAVSEVKLSLYLYIFASEGRQFPFNGRYCQFHWECSARFFEKKTCWTGQVGSPKKRFLTPALVSQRPTTNQVCARRVYSSFLVFSLFAPILIYKSSL